MPRVITANPTRSDNMILSENEQKAAVLHSLRDSMIRHKMLTGIVSSIDHVDSADGTQNYVTVMYNGVDVIIPIAKMGFTKEAMADEHRANMTANSMAGAEIDFIVEHVDTDRGVATASREAAMKQKAKDFFVGDGERPAIVTPGQLVEARIIGVMRYSIRLEVLGIEKYVNARTLNREWISDCTKKYEIGGVIIVRVTKIDASGEEPDITIEGAKIHDPFKSGCKVGGRYVGEITGYDKGRFFIHLDNGTNALAHSSASMEDYLPKPKDIVAFVVSRIQTENHIDTATGKIVRVIRRSHTV